MADDADTILQGYLGSDAIPAAQGSPAPKTADDIISHYTSDKTPGGVDVDSATGRPKVYITKPNPPHEGMTAEEVSKANDNAVQGGDNPRRYSSITNLPRDLLTSASEVPGDILQGTADRARAGIETFKSAGEDLAANKPATAVGKAAVGAAQYLTAPIASTLDNVVSKPIANVTGSDAIGNAAGDLAGFALPVSKLGSAVRASAPTKQAFSNFVEAIGGVDKIPSFLKDYTSNPRLAAMDVSPKLLQTTQKLAVTPGPHQNELSSVVGDRIASAKGAVTSAYDNTMGAPVDVLQKLNSMKKAARDVGQKQIQPVLDATNPVNVTPVIQHIDNILKPGVNSVVTSGSDLATTKVKETLAGVRKYLTDDQSNRTDPHDLHTIQSNLGNTAYKMSQSPNGEDRLIAGALTKVKEKIVDAIDAASPRAPASDDEILKANGFKQSDIDALGPALKQKTIDTLNKTNGPTLSNRGAYRPARANFADERHIDDAFKKGREVLQNNASNDKNLPEFWADWVKKAKPAEIEAAKEGARTAVRGQIEGMRNAVGQKGTEIPQVEFSKQKLSLLFGKKEVDDMSKQLFDERRIADTNNKLFQNSQTAMRLKADALVSDHTDKGLEGSSMLPYLAEIATLPTTGIPGAGASAIYALNAAKKNIINPILNNRADARNFELSRLASATGPEKQDIVQALTKLISPIPKQSLLSRASNVATKVIGP
jgi:hypothetical protein